MKRLLLPLLALVAFTTYAFADMTWPTRPDVNWSDEFMVSSGGYLTGQYGALATCQASGTSAACSTDVVSGKVGVFGMMQLTTGTTTTGRAGLASSLQIDFREGTWIYRATVGLTVLPTSGEDYDFVGGFGSSLSSSLSSGCYFLVDRSTSTDRWIAKCANKDGSTVVVLDGTGGTTSTPLSVVSWPSTNVADLTVRVVGASTAEFYFNGTLRATLTTNIPSTDLDTLNRYLTSVYKSAGTTARTVEVDWSQVHVGRTP